jgi:hypothetical protein
MLLILRIYMLLFFKALKNIQSEYRSNAILIQLYQHLTYIQELNAGLMFATFQLEYFIFPSPFQKYEH